MRYPTVAVVMLLNFFVSAGWARSWQAHRDGGNRLYLAGAPLAVVAQNGTDAGATGLTITPGAANSTRVVHVVDAVQNLAALQVQLHSAAEEVRIDMMTIGFGDQQGDTDFVETMRVQLIEDLNANGSRDDADITLGVRNVTDLEETGTITFNLTPPLILPPNSDLMLLVLLDINSLGTQAAQARRWARFPIPLMVQWLLVPLMFGLLHSFPSDHKRCSVFLLMLICCSLFLSGCSGGNDEELTFVVNLPSNGLTHQGIRLGPAQAISGVTIRFGEVS